MNIEYEAKFLNIDKDEVRERLKKIGAEIVRPEFLQKRNVYLLPKGHEIEGGWVRLRNEGDKITLALKVCAKTEKIEDQKEIEIKVSDFEKTAAILENIGCVKKSFQETKREIWRMDGVEICLDEWPFLEPFIEIESDSEERVKKAAEKIGFDYKKAKFCSVDYLCAEKYGISLDKINNYTPEIIFNMKNPFI